jgi:hypothetical protein
VKDNPKDVYEENCGFQTTKTTSLSQNALRKRDETAEKL